jgi:uncharacterized GH25 family protein
LHRCQDGDDDPVGHGPDRQRSPIGADRVVVFRSVGAGGAVDRRADLRLGGPAGDAELAFAQPGTHIVVFASNYTPSNLPAARFNPYLEEEGLTEAIRHREKTRTSDAPGREIYSRRAKALVQVGPRRAQPEPHVTAPVGLDLEIVPERHPYALGQNDRLPVRILYRGKPLPGALVKLTNLDADERPVETHRTDRTGRAVFRARRQGKWQLNVVWSSPLPANRNADFVTTFSSLTFGFR